MTFLENPNRLHAQLATMIALETDLEEKLNRLIPIASEHAEAGALLTEFQSLPGEHRKALETRLTALADFVPPRVDSRIVFPTEELIEHTCNQVTSVLQLVYTMFNRALIGYSVLHAYATRFLDWLEDEGTSFHLAVQFTKNYTQAIQKITSLIHDVVLWELDRDGYECQCICPSCGVGICLCSISARYHLYNAWQEAGPFYEAAPIEIQPPRKNSPAALAGLQRGHIITGVGDQELVSWIDLFNVLENAKSGDEIQLKVNQGSGTLSDIAIVKP